MISSGTVDAIRNETGNIRCDYFFPLGDEETVPLIDSWENQNDKASCVQIDNSQEAL